VGKSTLFEMDLLLGKSRPGLTVVIWRGGNIGLCFFPPHLSVGARLLILFFHPHPLTDINSEIYAVKQGDEIALMLTQ
jgi:hypothetical protein